MDSIKTRSQSQNQDESGTSIPQGYKVLQEGLARILYKEEKLQVDENKMIKTAKGKRQATE
jgi:hypothetical protein